MLAKECFYIPVTFFNSTDFICQVSNSYIQYRINVPHLFTDADNQLADDLSKVAAINIESLLSRTSEISKGIIYNICQSLLKEWGPESLGILPEDMIQQLLTGVIFYSF